MPLSNLLKSAAGTCRFCRQQAGILSREHPQCRRTHQAGWNEMVHLAAQAAASHNFDEKTFLLYLAEIARRPQVTLERNQEGRAIRGPPFLLNSDR